jgi:hypothetical protein
MHRATPHWGHHMADSLEIARIPAAQNVPTALPPCKGLCPSPHLSHPTLSESYAIQYAHATGVGCHPVGSLSREGRGHHAYQCRVPIDGTHALCLQQLPTPLQQLSDLRLDLVVPLGDRERGEGLKAPR